MSSSVRSKCCARRGIRRAASGGLSARGRAFRPPGADAACAANTSRTRWASTSGSRASSGSSSTRSAARPSPPTRSSSPPTRRSPPATSGTAARSLRPSPPRSSTAESPSRAAGPITGRSATGTRTARRAPGATRRASTPGSSTAPNGRGPGSAARTSSARSSRSPAGRAAPGPTSAGSDTTSFASTAARPATTSSTRRWTTYDKRVLYVTYDVTNVPPPGPERRRRHPRQRLVQIARPAPPDRYRARGRDEGRAGRATPPGRRRPAPSSRTASITARPTTPGCETPGWDGPGFDDKAWAPAEAVKGPAGVLSAQMMPAIQVVDTIVPLKMTNPQPGVYVFDMGQNFERLGAAQGQGARAAPTSGSGSPRCSTTTA